MVEITLILHAHQSFVLGFEKELEGFNTWLESSKDGGFPALCKYAQKCENYILFRGFCFEHQSKYLEFNMILLSAIPNFPMAKVSFIYKSM